MEWDGEESNTLRGEAQPAVPAAPGCRSSTSAIATARACSNSGTRRSPGGCRRPGSVFARQVYSTKEDKSIDRFAGFEYGGCCWRVRLLGPRYVSNRTGESDNSVMLQLELKGLSVGRNPQRHFPGARHSGILPRLRNHPP